jgi:hypothetical protein
MATSGRRQEGSVGDLSKAQAHRPKILCPHRSQQTRPGDESIERIERALRGAKRQWGQLADLDLLPPQTVCGATFAGDRPYRCFTIQPRSD